MVLIFNQNKEKQMKTVQKGQEVKRVSDAEASDMTKKGWSFCPKAVWKKIRGSK